MHWRKIVYLNIIVLIILLFFPLTGIAGPVEITFKLNLKVPENSRNVHVWIPYPVLGVTA